MVLILRDISLLIHLLRVLYIFIKEKSTVLRIRRIPTFLIMAKNRLHLQILRRTFIQSTFGPTGSSHDTVIELLGRLRQHDLPLLASRLGFAVIVQVKDQLETFWHDRFI